METSYKKKMVPVYQTETIEKKSITYRPIKKTSERVENYTEMEPVTVTKYREREVQETKYDTVTEMREESYISRRPVTETVMRDKEFKVREKVTENGFQYRDVTTYKPTAVAPCVEVRRVCCISRLLAQTRCSTRCRLCTCSQVAEIARNFGSTFSSGALAFGGDAS